MFCFLQSRLQFVVSFALVQSATRPATFSHVVAGNQGEPFLPSAALQRLCFMTQYFTGLEFLLFLVHANDMKRRYQLSVRETRKIAGKFAYFSPTSLTVS
jgi:hypothetical protein